MGSGIGKVRRGPYCWDPRSCWAGQDAEGETTEKERRRPRAGSWVGFRGGGWGQADRQRAERDRLEWKPGITVQGVREGQGIWSKASRKSRKMKTWSPCIQNVYLRNNLWESTFGRVVRAEQVDKRRQWMSGQWVNGGNLAGRGGKNKNLQKIVDKRKEIQRDN